jgi:hypothetical protein
MTWTQHVANGDRRSVDVLPSPPARTADPVQPAMFASTTAWIVAIMAFIAGLLLAGSLVFQGGNLINGGFNILAVALTVMLFGVLSSAIRGHPGAGLLNAGFICGVAALVLTFLLPVFGITGFTWLFGLVLWPVALMLGAAGLLTSRLVPPFVGWLAGAWGVLVALRDVLPWIALRLLGSPITIFVTTAAAGTLFLLALGVTLLVRSRDPQ